MVLSDATLELRHGVVTRYIASTCVFTFFIIKTTSLMYPDVGNTPKLLSWRTWKLVCGICLSRLNSYVTIALFSPKAIPVLSDGGTDSQQRCLLRLVCGHWGHSRTPRELRQVWLLRNMLAF